MSELAPLPSNLNNYKYCFVPNCKNTSSSTPFKEFVCVPTGLKRKAWFEAVGFADVTKNRPSFCCEDHLCLKNDLENYFEYKLLGVRKKLRADVVPRFNLQLSEQMETSQDFPDEPYSAPCQAINSSSAITTVQSKLGSSIAKIKSVEHKYVEAIPKTYVKSCQTDKTGTKNALVQATVLMKDITINCNLPAKSELQVCTKSTDTVNKSDSINSSHLDSSSSFIPSSSKMSIDSHEEKLKKITFQSSVYENYTKQLIENNPLVFLGINKNCTFIIDLLEKECTLSKKEIHLVLMKIRTDVSNTVLAYQFGLSESQLSRLFRKNIQIIAKYMQQLIVWPPAEIIIMNLPLQFRYRYRDVQSIIDCFEIEIEKPSDSVNQALTWSDYKKCNTAKYLISITPDGLINYISAGVCGRASDKIIVQKCGYLDKLPVNTSVLADKGFKQLDSILSKRNCQLVRPPSVSQEEKCSKTKVKSSKQISSVRIHVERVISRIRNFSFLDIHARTNNKLLGCLDAAVIIASALINLQSQKINQC